MLKTVKQRVLAGVAISLLLILLATVFFTNLAQVPEPLTITEAQAQWFFEQEVVQNLRLDFVNICYSPFLPEVNSYGVMVNNY